MKQLNTCVTEQLLISVDDAEIKEFVLMILFSFTLNTESVVPVIANVFLDIHNDNTMRN